MTRICVVRQFKFPQDVRVRREVEALLAAGHEVDVVCVADAGAPRRERHGRLRILRLPVRHRRGSPLMYLLSYAGFLALATLAVGAMHMRRRYRMVQVNTVPDTLVFSALVPKLTGARVLLDLHESMPEFCATKFALAPDHWAVRAVAMLERASIRFADAAIACTEQQRRAVGSRGTDVSRLGVVLNASDEAIFDPGRFARTRGDGRFTVVCHGTIEPHYGLDTLVRAAALLRAEIPELRVEIFGDGTDRPRVQELVRQLELEEMVWLSDGFVPQDELVAAIASADVGVVAMKRDPFRDLMHCNKMYDFIAMRVPAAVSRTRAVEAYFDQDCFRFFTPGDEHALAEALRELYRAPDLRERLAAHVAEVAEPYRWPRQREHYLAEVERLLADGAGAHGWSRDGRR